MAVSFQSPYLSENWLTADCNLVKYYRKIRRTHEIVLMEENPTENDVCKLLLPFGLTNAIFR